MHALAADAGGKAMKQSGYLKRAQQTQDKLLAIGMELGQ